MDILHLIIIGWIHLQHVPVTLAREIFHTKKLLQINPPPSM